MAYAALLSLMNVLEQVQLHERFHLLVKNQIQSLHEKISFLQEFLEECSLRRGDKAEDLESEIRDIAYAAEDIIEDHLVDYISGESVSEGDESSSLFCQDLEITISDLDFLKEEVMKIKENRGIKDQQLRNPTTAAGSSRAPDDTDAIVGSDEHLIRLMDELTGYESNCRIIPIVGMGGIGKTTLAKYVYVNLLIVQHFDIRVWVTVSQEYSVREILLGLCDTLVQEKLEMSDNDRAFGEHVHKSLFGKRYLVVLDDMWSIEAWDEIKMYFPDNNNGSRIVVTTRLLNLAHKFGSRSPYKMSFLGADESWKLFCNKIFGQGSCPVELQEIGKKIARNCEGLPLAIVVIAGFLAKSKRTKEYWEYVAEDLNSIVNSENEEHCLKTLSLSYDHLPNYLKPCFLYMGIFPEDSEISVPRLIKLWVAEGLLKPDRAKHLEEVAEENLQDLVDRNLVLVGKRSRRGKMRTCGMHDLLRDMCVREAQKEKIFYAKRISELKTSPSFYAKRISKLNTSPNFDATMISRHNTSEDIERARRISIHESTMKYENVSSDAQQPASLCLLSALLARSFLCNLEGISAEIICGKRLLRVLDTVDRLPVNDFLHLVNLRYLDCQIDNIFSSSIKHFQNLQTLIIKYPGCARTVLSSAIWQMPQLRHIHVWLAYLPEPPGEYCVLEKLQTLSTILNLRCTEDVIRAIPNVKKLKFVCEETSVFGAKWPYDGLNNLVHMHKLESATCVSRAEILPGLVADPFSLKRLAFPRSLKRLRLEGCRLPWENFTNIISSLPNLEVLKLVFNAFCGPVWELTEEDQFPQLKYLSISSHNWEHWTADSTHFPRLECLQLTACRKLNEIPWGIGEIPTLKLIQLYFCSESAAASAKEIVEEQHSLGNDVLRVLAKNEEVLKAQNEVWPYYGLNNHVHMYKLESVTCTAHAEMLPRHLAFPSSLNKLAFPSSLNKLAFPRSLRRPAFPRSPTGLHTFPCSLKKLRLEGCGLEWGNFTNIISSLPNLEVLKLVFNAFCGPVWKLAEEDQFPHLKYLSISSQDWEHWMADSTNFPRLECLQLTACRKLNEIPWGIGEIPTLKLIQLYFCSESAAASANEIVEEQRSFGNDVLQVLTENEEMLKAQNEVLKLCAPKKKIIKKASP